MQYGFAKEALVLGGSMAGMLAARVLSDHFERVTVIERDEYPETPEARDGVPQARHLHALLTQGHRILERLFPGITEDWQAAGAEILDLGRDFAWRTPSGWGIRFPSGLPSLAASRPLMDYVVQQKLREIPNISFLNGTFVNSLLTTDGGRRVTGVRVRTSEGIVRTLTGTLIVDATGRMSNAPSWLKQLGCKEPEETVVDARLGYATRMYRRRPAHERDWRAVFIQAEPPERPRAGIAFPVEGDRWVVTQCGGGGDFAPTDENEFLEFARSLPSGEIYNLIRSAEPLGPVRAYRRTENRWRRYDRLARSPEGFVIVGDAVCAFNPVYGQGITTAAMQALALDEWIRNGSVSTLALHKQIARIIATPWALATGEDRKYRGSTARAGLRERLLQSYVRQVMKVSSYDAGVRLALLEVFTMIADPARLLRTDVITGVLRSFIRTGAAARCDVPALAQVQAAEASA